LPRKFSADLLDWLQKNAIEDSVTWCGDCDEMVPEEKLCAHLVWDDELGEIVARAGRTEEEPNGGV
jgi:hypothetical protein